MVGLQMTVMLQPSSAETQNRRQMKEQPSKFFLVCGACGRNQGHGLCVSVKMLPVKRKVQCVLRLAKFESVTPVRREYRRVFNEEPPHENNIRRWDKKLKETGSLLDKKLSGRPSVSDESVEAIRTSFLRSPRKSVRKCARELGLPKTIVHRVLKKRLHFTGYKLQLLHASRPGDTRKRRDFATDMLNEIDDDELFLERIVFSDEATFHISGHVHSHNIRMWGQEHPHAIVEHERDSPKINVWCGLAHDQVIGPIFFAECTVKSTTYLDMLELFAVPQIGGNSVIFQQDGSPPHFANIVR
jgi:transposase